MSLPRLSIIMAVRNVGTSVEATLRSLCDQTWTGWELIIIDGASTDGTLTALAPFRDHIATLISEPDQGIADAWNKALPHCRGEWVLFLGAGDRLWQADTLARVMPVLDSLAPECGVCYGRVAVADRHGRIVEELGKPWEAAVRDLSTAMPIPHQGTFQRRALFDRTGGFDTSLHYAIDYDFMLRTLPQSPPNFMNMTVSVFVEGGVSTRPELRLAVMREYRRVRCRYGFSARPGWLDVKALVLLCLHHALGPGRLRMIRGRMWKP